ncbi:MAG: hypothetical protein VCF07_10475 [Nitrospinota bacterium]
MDVQQMDLFYEAKMLELPVSPDLVDGVHLETVRNVVALLGGVQSRTDPQSVQSAHLGRALRELAEYLGERRFALEA